jgi:hypothetical protein
VGFFSLELLWREKKSHVHHVVRCSAISRMIFIQIVVTNLVFSRTFQVPLKVFFQFKALFKELYVPFGEDAGRI